MAVAKAVTSPWGCASPPHNSKVGERRIKRAALLVSSRKCNLGWRRSVTAGTQAGCGRRRLERLRRRASSGGGGGSDDEKEEGKTGGWRFPWSRKIDGEKKRKEEEEEEEKEVADRERKERDGIFVVDLDKESLELRWQDLLDPTVENVLALILSACLVLAVAQILWQLFIVAAAITVSAIKYTVLAVFLVGILVFLV